jgi:DNA topoisomerase I
VQFARNGTVIFEFVGKSKIKHRKLLVDQELALLLRDLVNIGRGRKLFQYFDELQKPRPVTPSQINAYIKTLTSPEFSSKDFRTWGASLLAATEFAELGVAETEQQLKKNIVRVVKSVAEQLGNTPTVCRGSYIHPNVIKAYMRGITLLHFTPRKRQSLKRIETAELDPAELSLIELFRKFS